MFRTTLLYLALISTTLGATDFFSTSNRNLLLTFSPNPNSIISSFSSRSFSSRGEKITQIVVSLKNNAQTAQEDVQAFLSSKNVAFTPIWISNQLSIRNVADELISELSSRFNNSGIIIGEDVVIPLEDLYLDGPSLLQNPPPREDGIEEWGVQKVRSAEAHFLLSSMDIVPTPVVVGVVDTGVRYTHEALASTYNGTYGWFDPFSLTPFPNDDHGHGSHVTGTIMGTKGIGVASSLNTKWIACKGCAPAGCPFSTLLQCGQYITCPTLPDMSNPDCSRAPSIVNNSWGSIGGQEWFDVVINMWHAAGIIPVFSAGNAGPLCGTVGSPGDRNVISVGSTAVNDMISAFSARGPTLAGAGGVLKPDLSAPGQLVLSSTNESDTSYGIYQGTSMAAPHVSGVIAILKSANPSLTYDEVKHWLAHGVDTASLLSQNLTCGGIPDNVFPNFVYGHGRVNAFKSLTGLLATGITTTTTTPESTTMTTTTTTESSGVVIKTWPSCLIMLFVLSQIYISLIY